ncbi:MAG: hypothetical protein UW17_C0027G0006 [Candidatus Nomurabacteria bacterium GW2011_GWD1_44_10]|nr:MAG: hypothetical protein UW17_C0027G0006 [Candidatus Nomurabacteria bacterium GW2011_GWD1_44_10]
MCIDYVDKKVQFELESLASLLYNQAVSLKGPVAHLVERPHGMRKVVGPSPIGSTVKNTPSQRGIL